MLQRFSEMGCKVKEVFEKFSLAHYFMIKKPTYSARQAYNFVQQYLI